MCTPPPLFRRTIRFEQRYHGVSDGDPNHQLSVNDAGCMYGSKGEAVRARYGAVDKDVALEEALSVGSSPTLCL